MAAASSIRADNIQVEIPEGTLAAGQQVPIKWSNAETGYVNIQLANADSNIINYPIDLATVKAGPGEFMWTVPDNMKSASDYKILVWGSVAPSFDSKNDVSPAFTILNTNVHAVNTFVTHSNTDCHPGKTCKISWDYPDMGMYPSMVDVYACKVGDDKCDNFLGTVMTNQKSMDWDVPANTPVGSEFYFIATGGGLPVLGEGFSNDMGANSPAFVITEFTEKPVEEEKNDLFDADLSAQSSGASKNGAGLIAVALSMIAVVPMLF